MDATLTLCSTGTRLQYFYYVYALSEEKGDELPIMSIAVTKKKQRNSNINTYI